MLWEVTINKHWEVGLKKLGCASFFNARFSVWISDETLFLVFDISLLKLINNSWRENKEIATVKEVWICDPNYHKIRRSFALIFSKNYQCFEKLYQTLGRVFHTMSKHFEVGLKKLVFSIHFSVFRYLMKHSSWYPGIWFMAWKYSIKQVHESEIRAIFKWLSKVITWFRLLSLMIGLKDSRQFFNQWEAKP